MQHLQTAPVLLVLPLLVGAGAGLLNGGEGGTSTTAAIEDNKSK